MGQKNKPTYYRQLHQGIDTSSKNQRYKLNRYLESSPSFSIKSADNEKQVQKYRKRTLWEKRNPFTAGNRFSLLQRPRSQDISGIPVENNSAHDSVENDSRFFSPKQKLNFVKKGNLVWEENRHLGKFL